jgi:methionine sulfoxide reductase heme-binding subunit
MKYPWLDYGGRFSPLKALVFGLLFVPGLWVAYALAFDLLGSRPLTEALHQIGQWTIRLIFLSLAITPFRRLFQWPRLILVRRMIGVAAFAYGVTHLTLYTADQSFNLPRVASEIVLRFYLTIGFVALLGLTALAVTSTDGMVRRMGGQRWQQLHRLIYVIGILAVIHYFLQSKLNEWEPTMLAGFYVWLMGWRLLGWIWRRADRAPIWRAAALTIVAGVGTAIGEALYFWWRLGVDPGRILAVNFSLDTGIRPSLAVLGTGAAITLVAALRTAFKRYQAWRPRPV